MNAASTLRPEQTLSEMATHLPGASRVFHRHRLDFCCGGQRSLTEACAARGLDPALILAELRAEEGQGPAIDWSQRPLAELIDHILTRYHTPLRAELPRLRDMAAKVERVHADKSTCPRGLAEHLGRVIDAVEDHLKKEERVLFPLIAAGQGPAAGMPVMVMEREHVEHADDLRRTRALTGDLTPPPEACATWRALYLGLAQLERELMDHIHLENNVLFPRALER